MHINLKMALDRFAAKAGHPTVQQTLNRTGATKARKGADVLAFKPEPRRYWIEKE